MKGAVDPAAIAAIGRAMGQVSVATAYEVRTRTIAAVGRAMREAAGPSAPEAAVALGRAMSKVSAALGLRAEAIVRTETGRIHSTAGQERLEREDRSRPDSGSI